jgi:predicted ABC-type ATPase
MPRPLPIFWGNFSWELSDDDRIVRTGALGPEHPHWIDYSQVTGESSDLCANSHPHRSYRTKFHDQIIRDSLSNIQEHCSSESPSCVLTHGGIASGKTSAIDLFLDNTDEKYFHIDFDRMKIQLPEYEFMKGQNIQSAASFAQAESAKLAAKLFKKAIKLKANIIYEGSLARLEVMPERIREMKRKGYVIVVVSTHVTEVTGQRRAISRYNAGGRYVPPNVVAETYNSCPSSLVQLKDLVDMVFMVNNELENQPAQEVLLVKDGKLKIMDEQLYAQYLQVVGKGNALN